MTGDGTPQRWLKSSEEHWHQFQQPVTADATHPGLGANRSPLMKNIPAGRLFDMTPSTAIESGQLHRQASFRERVPSSVATTAAAYMAAASVQGRLAALELARLLMLAQRHSFAHLQQQQQQQQQHPTNPDDMSTLSANSLKLLPTDVKADSRRWTTITGWSKYNNNNNNNNINNINNQTAVKQSTGDLCN